MSPSRRAIRQANRCGRCRLVGTYRFLIEPNNRGFAVCGQMIVERFASDGSSQVEREAVDAYAQGGQGY